ncbi:MAG: DUF1015 domain-containing protein [Dehalococcoidia bacterium]|nr:DUF1015 domain-containing protein [Dehalococcoidia bacterium]
MCDIRPFCGLRYNLQRVEDPSSVICPPYDVISPEQRSLYHRASPYNIIRLESGEDEPGDNSGNNKYTRASSTLSSWISEGVLVRDKKPAFYVIEHRFLHQGEAISRWDLLARLRLEDFSSGNVRPHEKTTKKPAADRLTLLRTSRTNFSPIMGLFRSDEGKMLALLRDTARKAPDFAAVDRDGVEHLLRIVDEEKTVGQITDHFREKPVYIADGHHRYETALQFMKEHRTLDAGENKAVNFVMISLMDSTDSGIVMYPTHRLIRGLDPISARRLKEAISLYFTAIPVPSLPENEQGESGWLRGFHQHAAPVIGLYNGSGDFTILKLRRDANLAGVMSDREMRVWGNLDVVLLHRLVIESVLSFNSENGNAANIEYTRDPHEARTRVDSGEFQFAFFLNPTPVSSILNTADMGKRLPPKTTYFFPKTPAGLVLNPLWDD